VRENVSISDALGGGSEMARAAGGLAEASGAGFVASGSPAGGGDGRVLRTPGAPVPVERTCVVWCVHGRCRELQSLNRQWGCEVKVK
jgi:hypothetical protein